MFEFVTVTHPNEQCDQQQTRRRIRQHAIRTGIQNKRKEEARRKENFVAVNFDVQTGKSKKNAPTRAISLTKPVSGGSLDPFDSLPGDGERVRALMVHKVSNKRSVRSASQPGLCVEEAGKIFLDGIDGVFRGALSDPSLYHTLSLSLAFAVDAKIPGIACLTLRGQTLSNLRHRISDYPKLVPSIATLTAILMVIEYECRMEGSNANSITMHAGAAKKVLELTEASDVQITDAMRRALFWKDLYSCFFVGTTRLLSHRDYEELSSEKIPSSIPGYSVPPGFQSVVLGFPGEFAEILVDLNALCDLVDTRCPGSLTEEHLIDDFQYYIESRLVDLLSKSRTSDAEDLVFQACIFATFLVTYEMSVGIWEGCFIPEYCAAQVISLLTKAESDPRWEIDGFKELRLWLLFVCGSMAKQSRMRLRAIKMIYNTCHEFLDGSHDEWGVLCGVLKTFVWSRRSMEQRSWHFYQEICSQQPWILT